MIDSIEISKLEYYNLLRDAEVLKRLEAGGVDNWTGYYDSVYGMEENEENHGRLGRKNQESIIWHCLKK